MNRKALIHAPTIYHLYICMHFHITHIQIPFFHRNETTTTCNSSSTGKKCLIDEFVPWFDLNETKTKYANKSTHRKSGEQKIEMKNWSAINSMCKKDAFFLNTCVSVHVCWSRMQRRNQFWCYSLFQCLHMWFVSLFISSWTKRQIWQRMQFSRI